MKKGPTLEIFEYEPFKQRDSLPCVNGQGFGHLAFHVDSVEEMLDELLKYGGEQIGELTSKEYEGIGTLTVVYARDPEGNIIEIQNWRK